MNRRTEEETEYVGFGLLLAMSILGTGLTAAFTYICLYVVSL